MKNYLIAFALGVLTSFGGMVAWQHAPPPAIEGKTAPAIANVKTETVPIKSIVAYTAPAKRKLDLPKAVQDNPNDHVTSATVVTGDARDKIVTAVIDAEGNTMMYVQPQPLPWFAREKTTEFSLNYGYKRDAVQPVTRFGVTADLLQIKALHAGINASADSDGAWFAGVGIRLTIK
jgi:hypothetical protein